MRILTYEQKCMGIGLVVEAGGSVRKVEGVFLTPFLSNAAQSQPLGPVNDLLPKCVG